MAVMVEVQIPEQAMAVASAGSTGDDSEGFPVNLPVRKTNSARSVCSSSSLQKCLDLAGKAEQSLWKLRHEDIHIERQLSQTLKSYVQLGRWHGTKVVVKTLIPPAQLQQEGGTQGSSGSAALALTDELLHEVETLSSIRHPDLVLFLGACLDESRPIACVMEYMPGGDLQHFYAAKRQKHQVPDWHPNLNRVVGWASAVARALSFLHGRAVPIVHRDLKPMNLLLTRHLDVKVADLGISRVVEVAPPGTGEANSTGAKGDVYVMTGGVGTLLYMAPEVVRHQRYNEKVDIFSFALILYFLSSGCEPFHHLASQAEPILQAYLEGQEPRPRISDCQPRLSKLICAAWHEDASLRPSAQGMLQDLEELEGQAKLSCLCLQM